MFTQRQKSVAALVMGLAAAGSTTGVFAQSSQSTAPSSTTPPIMIVKVYRGTGDLFPNPNNMTVGVLFENVSEKTAVAVKWYVHLEDAFDKVLDTKTVYSYGKFTPNAVIDPTGSWKEKTLASSAGSEDAVSYGHAWKLVNTYGDEVARFVFEVAAVRFEDGTVWTSPTAQEFP